MTASPNAHDWVGYAAALLTTASFVPQAALTLRTRDTSGVSLPMYVLFTCGVALWLAYGLLLRAWPVIAANAITLALACTILVATWRNRRGPPSTHRPTP